MLRTLATSSIALIVGASPVFADLTPAQVWESLSKYYTDSGYTVKVGEEIQTGDGLELSNVELSMSLQSDADSKDTGASQVKVLFPKLIFTAVDSDSVKSVMEGDATVEVDYSAPESANPEEQKKVEAGMEDFPLNIVISAPENETISSGTPKDIRHEYNFPTLKMTMKMDQEIEDEGESSDLKLNGEFALNNMTGWTTLEEGENWQMDQEIAAETASFDLSFTETPKAAADTPEQAGEEPSDGKAETSEEPSSEPKDPVTFTAQATMEALKSTGQGVIPMGQADITSQLDKALEAGMDMDGTLEFGAISGQFNMDSSGTGGNPKSANGKFSSEGGDLKFALSKEGMAYSGNSEASEFEMSVADLPFPFSYAIEGSTFDMAFPISKSEEAQPFKLSYALNGLTLGDGIWNLFDPENKLPRDPAELAIDLEGLGVVHQNLFDPSLGQQIEEQADKAAENAKEGETDTAEAAPEPQVPFVPQSLTVNKIALDMIGAQADLSGDLTFPEGSQAPVGKISGDFSGINALLDKLVEAGLVPQEQVMGARMMMTMFTKPVEGQEDQLQSEIEFKEDGSIHANGQRIR